MRVTEDGGPGWWLECRRRRQSHEAYSRGPLRLAPGGGPVSLPLPMRTHGMALNCGRGLTLTGQPRLNATPITYLHTHTRSGLESVPPKFMASRNLGPDLT